MIAEKQISASLLHEITRTKTDDHRILDTVCKANGMRIPTLIKQSLLYYWRTNLAVVLGVATAVSVLAGALLVGDSVRASLRDLVVQRLGKTSYIISSNGFLREQLSDDIQGDPRFAASGPQTACPLMLLEGTVTHEPSKRVASKISV